MSGLFRSDNEVKIGAGVIAVSDKEYLLIHSEVKEIGLVRLCDGDLVSTTSCEDPDWISLEEFRTLTKYLQQTDSDWYFKECKIK